MITLTTVSSGSEVAKSLIAEWATADDYIQAKLRRSKTNQLNFLLTRAALRGLLTHVTGERDWHIRPDAQGKPQAITSTGALAAHISLSHTNGLIACAVSQEGPLGVDVEYWRVRDFIALANYAFGRLEREAVSRNGISAFYRIWTLREALSKVTGAGLIATIDGLDRVAGAPASGFWSTETEHLFYVQPHDNYSLAIASESENIWTETSIRWIDLTLASAESIESMASNT